MSESNKIPPMTGFFQMDDGVVAIEGDPQVLLKNALVICKNGKEHRIDAEFDFDELPKELHDLAIQMIVSMRLRIII